MDKIKDKGLSTLLAEGQFNFYGPDVEVYNCLSEDLTTEEIDAAINLSENILPKLPDAIRKLKEMEDNYDALRDKDTSPVEESYGNTPTTEDTYNSNQSNSSAGLILGIAFMIVGFLLITPKYLGLSSPEANMCMLWGILCFIPGISILILVPASTSSKEEKEETLQKAEPAFVENEQQKRIQNDRRIICNQIGLVPENNCICYEDLKIKVDTFWDTSARMLSRRLPLLLVQLKRLKVVHQDDSLSSSAKMLAIAQLFSLMNNDIINAKMLEEKRKSNEAMADQLQEMKKQSRELEAQNDMLTLQTYNKISEMEGHNPNIVAAQTYAQMSKILNKREKKD